MADTDEELDSPTYGQGPVVVIPDSLTPTGVASMLLTSYGSQLLGVISLLVLAGVVVAAVHVIRSRFGRKRGFVVYDYRPPRGRPKWWDEDAPF